MGINATDNEDICGDAEDEEVASPQEEQHDNEGVVRERIPQTSSFDMYTSYRYIWTHRWWQACEVGRSKGHRRIESELTGCHPWRTRGSSQTGICGGRQIFILRSALRAPGFQALSSLHSFSRHSAKGGLLAPPNPYITSASFSPPELSAPSYANDSSAVCHSLRSGQLREWRMS